MLNTYITLSVILLIAYSTRISPMEPTFSPQQYAAIEIVGQRNRPVPSNDIEALKQLLNDESRMGEWVPVFVRLVSNTKSDDQGEEKIRLAAEKIHAHFDSLTLTEHQQEVLIKKLPSFSSIGKIQALHDQLKTQKKELSRFVISPRGEALKTQQNQRFRRSNSMSSVSGSPSQPNPTDDNELQKKLKERQQLENDNLQKEKVRKKAEEQAKRADNEENERNKRQALEERQQRATLQGVRQAPVRSEFNEIAASFASIISGNRVQSPSTQSTSPEMQREQQPEARTMKRSVSFSDAANNLTKNLAVLSPRIKEKTSQAAQTNSSSLLQTSPTNQAAQQPLQGTTDPLIKDAMKKRRGSMSGGSPTKERDSSSADSSSNISPDSSFIVHQNPSGNAHEQVSRSAAPILVQDPASTSGSPLLTNSLVGSPPPPPPPPTDQDLKQAARNIKKEPSKLTTRTSNASVAPARQASNGQSNPSSISFADIKSARGGLRKVADNRSVAASVPVTPPTVVVSQPQNNKRAAIPRSTGTQTREGIQSRPTQPVPHASASPQASRTQVPRSVQPPARIQQTPRARAATPQNRVLIPNRAPVSKPSVPQARQAAAKRLALPSTSVPAMRVTPAPHNNLHLFDPIKKKKTMGYYVKRFAGYTCLGIAAYLGGTELYQYYQNTNKEQPPLHKGHTPYTLNID